MLRNDYLKTGYQLWLEKEEQRKDFNGVSIQTLPINSCTFEQFKDIQGDNAIDPTLQDNVLLPKGFTECIYHVGNANELNSITRNGLIPGGTKPQERKTSGLLHHSEPDGRRTWHRRNTMRSYETKDRAIQEYLETPSKHSILVHLKLAQEKDWQFYQTRSHRKRYV